MESYDVSGVLISIKEKLSSVRGLIVGVSAWGKTDYLDNIVLCEGHLNV